MKRFVRVPGPNEVVAREPLPPASGQGLILYLDAGSGLAGDMLVAALLDLGVPEAIVVSGLAGLALTGYELKHSRVLRSSISARHFEVSVENAQPPRDYRSIVQLLEAATSLSDGVLLWQVACEFVAASRKLAPFGFTQTQAWHEVERLRVLWKLILPSENVLPRAEQLMTTHNLSFWDAMIVAACMEGSITRLYTEDFDDSLRQATGVEIVNPF